jgi:glucose dehydrogenase
LDAATGVVQHELDAVPVGCTGGGIWGSPTYDASDGSLYVTTGDEGDRSEEERYAVALLKVRGSDLALRAYWHLPAVEQTPGGDSDFGSAPTLFSGTVTSGGRERGLVGVVNKNGVYYVFDRNDLSGGPVARLPVLDWHKDTAASHRAGTTVRRCTSPAA